MENHISKQSLINAAVTSADVDTTTMPLYVRLPGLVPMLTGKGYIKVTKTAYAAEVRQVVTIGGASVPVIVAATKYQLGIGNTGTRVEGAQSQIKKYGATSAAILSGTAAIDRWNVYVDLAYKINHDASAKCIAYPVETVPQSANATAFAVGETVTGGTSGATGVITAGTTGTLTVRSTNSIAFVTGEALTGSIAGAGTAGTVVLGVSMQIVDNAGYYDVYGLRLGANTVKATVGFTAAQCVITTAAVYSEGDGTVLLTHVFSKERTSDNLATGEYGFASNNLPISSSHYDRYDIVYSPPATSSALTELKGSAEFRQRIYVDPNVGGYNANWSTAMLALT